MLDESKLDLQTALQRVVDIITTTEDEAAIRAPRGDK